MRREKKEQEKGNIGGSGGKEGGDTYGEKGRK
jgi:hypothetical protein